MSSPKSAPNKPITIPILWEGESDAPVLPELPPALEIGAQAATAALIGGMNGMMREGAARFQDLQSGKLDQKQFTYRLIRKGTESALTSGTKAAAAIGMKHGVVFAAKRIGARQVLRFARSNAFTAICYGVVDQTGDTIKYFRGELNVTAYKVQTTENLGGTSGALGGAALGAVVGSVVPGIGTSIGMLLGMLGAAGGANIGKTLGKKWFGEEKETPSDAQGNDSSDPQA